jgi:hypothetical protein
MRPLSRKDNILFLHWEKERRGWKRRRKDRWERKVSWEKSGL